MGMPCGLGRALTEAKRAREGMVPPHEAGPAQSSMRETVPGGQERAVEAEGRVKQAISREEGGIAFR